MDGQHSSPFKRAVSLEIKFRDGPRLPPANLLRRLQRATSEPCPRAETLDEKLQRAEQNRQELRAQFLTKQRDRDTRHAAYVKAMEERRKKHLALLQGRLDVASALRASQLEQRRSHARKLVGLQAVATRQEQRRQERRARLQDRLELATLHHSAEIGQRRNRAARLLARRDVALSRLLLRQEQQVYHRAKRLHEQQEDAEFRRRIGLVHEQERLRQEHQMKLAKALETQLKMDEMRELQRCMLNERMAQAEQSRSMCLDFRAARAGARVTLARCRGYQAHTLREQEAKALRCKLEGQMRSAEERRQAALLSKVAKSRRTI